MDYTICTVNTVLPFRHDQILILGLDINREIDFHNFRIGCVSCFYDNNKNVIYILVRVGEDFGAGFSDQVCCLMCLFTHPVHHGNASSYEKAS